ncbi:MAG: DUF58 domain-containing protein [Bdellovibrionales bacterium]|nr:DUF58 domain-containing protein [Bdellovibrionales bacterium]
MQGSLPPEIRKKVRLLEISTRKLVNSLFTGSYHSAFKGQGMTFSEFREYVPGDDVRTISWPLTARTGKVYIKKFDEERELTLMLVVDVSGSLDFGTGNEFKGEVATHLSALLGFAAQKNNDHVGLLLFSDQVEHFVPAKKGRGHVNRILRDLYYQKPLHHATKINSAVQYLQGVLKKRAIVFVFSDFYDDSFAEAMKTMSKKHDVIAVVVDDPAERNLPDVGLVDMRDAETGEVFTVDTGSYAFRKEFEAEMKKRREVRERELRKAGVDRIDVSTNADFVAPLAAYFRRRGGGGR